MKKSILEIGVALNRVEQKLVLGGNGDPQDPGQPGGGGSEGGGSGETCEYTCTHSGDCYGVHNGQPSFCQAGCCITPS